MKKFIVGLLLLSVAGTVVARKGRVAVSQQGAKYKEQQETEEQGSLRETREKESKEIAARLSTKPAAEIIQYFSTLSSKDQVKEIMRLLPDAKRIEIRNRVLLIPAVRNPEDRS